MVQQRIKLVFGVYHHNESLYSLHWADSDYFGEGKIRKCGISNARGWKASGKTRRKPQTNATLFPSLLAPTPQGKKATITKAILTVVCAIVSWQTT